MSWYKFVQDSSRERKFVRLPLSFCVLIHLGNAFYIVPHFFHHFGGSQNADGLAQTANPSEELWADFNVRMNGKMLFIVGNHHNVPPEAVNYHIRQVIGEPDLYLLDFAGKHREHPQRTLRQIQFLKLFLSLPLLGYNADTIHLIYTEMLHLPALISQKIIVVIAPQQGIGACGVKFAFFVKCLLFFRGEIEVFESDLPVIGDSGVEIVKVVLWMKL